MSPYPLILFLFGVAIGISPWITNIMDSYGKGVTQKTKGENSRSSEKFVRIQNLDKISGQTPSIKNLEAFLLEYSELPPEEAGKKLFELAQHPDSDFNRYPVLFFLARQWGQTSPQEAREFLTLPGNDTKYNPLTEGIMKGWAQTDWTGALNHLMENKEKNGSDRVFCSLMKDRVKSAQDDLITWFSYQSKEVRVLALQPILEGLTESHSHLTARLISSLQPGDLNMHSFTNNSFDNTRDLVLNALSYSDWDTALNWIKSQDDIIHDGYQTYFAFLALAKADYKKATEEFHKWDTENTHHVASAIIDTVKNRSPLEAMQWLQNNLKVYTPSYAANIAYETSAQTPEFTEYVNRLPNSEIKDAALSAMMEARSRMDGTFSMDSILVLSSSISDTSSRQNAIESSIKYRVQKSPEETGKWIKNTSKLSEKDKEFLLRFCNENLLKNEVSE